MFYQMEPSQSRRYGDLFPYSMGRMEYNWGPDAASFNPERWLEEGFFENASPFKFTAFQVRSLSNLNRTHPRKFKVINIETTLPRQDQEYA